MVGNFGNFYKKVEITGYSTLSAKREVYL